MTWTIENLVSEGVGAASMSDGLPVTKLERGGMGSCYRMYVLKAGMIECVDHGDAL